MCFLSIYYFKWEHNLTKIGISAIAYCLKNLKHYDRIPLQLESSFWANGGENQAGRPQWTHLLGCPPYTQQSLPVSGDLFLLSNNK